MIQEKINKLIPFISENFITYPLWEVTANVKRLCVSAVIELLMLNLKQK